MKISTVIISLNEAQHIGQCVEQAVKWCDEVIVVDAESTDETVKIAEEKGAKVYVKAWEGYGSAKNFGNSKAANDWILSLDADEMLSDEWIANNQNFTAEPGTIYLIDLVTLYFGKRLNHSGFYPLWKKRLFNRKEFRWNEDPVHEALEGTKHYKAVRLKGKVWHHSFKSKGAYVQKLDSYARLGAQKWIEQGSRPGLLKQHLGPAFRFFKTYFLDLGALDGKAGYEIAKMNMDANRAKLKYYKEMVEKG
jgi:glycosyltransferase involved in cell wall biosynthesis